MEHLNINKLSFANFDIVFICANVLAMVCTLVVVISIFVDFVKFHQPRIGKKKINSWVETGSMFIYFFVYYLLLKAEGMRLMPPVLGIDRVLWILGSLLMLVGCVVNVKGRFDLNKNWANQVTIYHDQTLVTNGVYSLVRHPLYASLIWMLLGGALIYCSVAALLSVLILFIPMMYYRAGQEERLLMAEFEKYVDYRLVVGMFFPKINKHGRI